MCDALRPHEIFKPPIEISAELKERLQEIGQQNPVVETVIRAFGANSRGPIQEMSSMVQLYRLLESQGRANLLELQYK